MRRIAIILLLLWAAAHAQWTEPEQITTGGSFYNPQAAVIGDTIHITGPAVIYINYLRSNDNGRSWTELVYPPQDFYRSYMPDIFCSNGYVHLVFQGRFQVQSPLCLYHMVSEDGGRSWGEPHQIHSDIWKYPRITGNVDTLFVSFVSEDSLLVSVSFDNGGSWQGPYQADYRSVIDSPPNIMYSNGRLHLVYQFGANEDSAGIEIYYRYSDDLGLTWSERYGLSTLENWHERKYGQIPSAYADSDGNLIALWMDYKYGSACGIPAGDILGRVSTDNGTSWLPEIRLTDTQTGRGSSAVIVNDIIHVVWEDLYPYDCIYSKLMYAESSDWGASWTVPQLISGYIERNDQGPCLFYNISQGDTVFHCIWNVYDPPNAGLCYVRSQQFTGIDRGHEIDRPDAITFSAYPNPFNSTTTITYANFTLGTISIYNIAGQKVATLPVAAAEGEATWDGTDATGSAVSSGIYFVRATGLSGAQTIKLVYLK